MCAIRAETDGPFRNEIVTTSYCRFPGTWNADSDTRCKRGSVDVTVKLPLRPVALGLVYLDVVYLIATWAPMEIPIFGAPECPTYLHAVSVFVEPYRIVVVSRRQGPEVTRGSGGGDLIVLIASTMHRDRANRSFLKSPRGKSFSRMIS